VVAAVAVVARTRNTAPPRTCTGRPAGRIPVAAPALAAAAAAVVPV